ncbi:SDR family NAD(P)-dependent oxidoreductase, partial [Lysobacter sp. 2RAB21]
MNKRIAVVSGGIGGLGTEICLSLARAGRRVIALDLGAREERIAQFAALTDGVVIRCEAANVADYDDCGAASERVVGVDGALDCLVYAAGI